nr:MAG TPA: hypothetical protein [Caudoviricetes sp.]
MMVQENRLCRNSRIILIALLSKGCHTEIS